MTLRNASALRALLMIVVTWVVVRLLWLWVTDPLQKGVSKAMTVALDRKHVSAASPTVSGRRPVGAPPETGRPNHSVDEGRRLRGAVAGQEARNWPRRQVQLVSPRGAKPVAALPDDREPDDDTHFLSLRYPDDARAIALPDMVLTSPSQEQEPSLRWRPRPRTSLSAWTIIRPDSRSRALVSGSQLGASQAGVRLRQDWHHPVAGVVAAANFRLSAALSESAERELALGLAFRSLREPRVELIVEQRLALDPGGANRMAILLAGGIDDQKLPLGTKLSGYGQAGVAGFSGRRLFADGRLTIAAPISSDKPGPISAGLAIAGGMQPGASRIDIGPLLMWRQQLAGGAVSVSAEYRWRIAGQAQPPTGPALSIGADF